MTEHNLGNGERVTIKCFGIEATGTILSAYTEHVWEGIPGRAKLIGVQPAGIEMSEDGGGYRYWKVLDDSGRGKVWHYPDGEKQQIFPRDPLVGWTGLEHRTTSRVFKDYFGREYDIVSSPWNNFQFNEILGLVRVWFSGNGVFNQVGYDKALELARTLPGTTDRVYVNDVRIIYNDAVEGGIQNL